MSLAFTAGMALTRELVALCERSVPDPGPSPGVSFLTDAEYAHEADNLLRGCPNVPFWVLAYGSLLWKPACATADTRRARVDGWRRDFCLKLNRWRGSPEQPGLMMGLRRGGSCEAMIFRLPEVGTEKELTRLLRRELSTRDGLEHARWITVDTAQGPERALAFWADPTTSRHFVDIDLREAAHVLARACGHIGSGAAYLHETVRALSALGIRDDYLWALQQHVAEVIMSQQFLDHFLLDQSPDEFPEDGMR